MTSTHSSYSVHSSTPASHNNSHNNSPSGSHPSAASHSISYGATLRSGVPDDSTSSSDPGTLSVLTAAINDIRTSFGLSRVSTPSTYAGLETLVNGLSTSITRYQWGSKTISGYGDTNTSHGKANHGNSPGPSGHGNSAAYNTVLTAGSHASTSVTSAGGSVHGSSPGELNGSVVATLTAPAWSTTPSTLLSNLNASKVLLNHYLVSYGSYSYGISSRHTNGNTPHSDHGSHSSSEGN